MPLDWLTMVKETLKTLTPQFSTRRMVKEYVEKFYAPASKD
jgi:starch phosphorylase